MLPDIFDMLRLVGDDTAALRFGCVRGRCQDVPVKRQNPPVQLPKYVKLEESAEYKSRGAFRMLECVDVSASLIARR